LNLSKGAYYYSAVEMDPFNLQLMDEIDRLNTKTPFYGSRRITVSLRKLGHPVNRKRIQRLMRLMGLEAIYPKGNLSKRNQAHKIYPYLLNNVQINRPNLVWSTDITYIRIGGGFVYLTAVIDWYSRYVLSWNLSNSLHSDFCITAMEEALQQSVPKIVNTDQGVQFTSKDFIDMLKGNDIKISMDSKGRALDNIFVERLWRSLKYEEVYLKNYQRVPEAKKSLKNYFNFYNHERPHQSLSYKTPGDVHYDYVALNN
jgi:putative transposase